MPIVNGMFYLIVILKQISIIGTIAGRLQLPVFFVC